MNNDKESILIQRLNTVKDFIRKSDKGSGVILQRKEILSLVGITEGDNAKKLIKALDACNEIKVIKEKKQNRYFYIPEDGQEDSHEKYPDAELILHNVTKVGNKYFTYKSAAELQSLWSEGHITYNPEIQRGVKIVYRKDGEQEVPVYSVSNVKQIALKVISGDYKIDTIVTNILHDGTDKLVYEDGTLYILAGKHNILDGQHRLRAFDLVKKISDEGGTKSNLDSYIFHLQIENYNLEDAQDAFYQYTKGLKVSTSRAEYFNNKNYENAVVKELLSKSDLKNKVEIIQNTINKKSQTKIVTFATLVNSIKMAFPNIQTSEQAAKISSFLCDFFNALIAEIPELYDYEKRTASKEHSLIAENFVFYGYMAVASYLFDKENWKELIEKILEIDYEKNSKLWYGKIVRKGKNSAYSITNNADGRVFFSNKFKKEFVKLVEYNTEKKVG